MKYDPREPDALLVPLFKHHPQENAAKTKVAGRPIFDDVEVVEIRFPGSRNTSVHPVHEVSHWEDDPYTGRQRQVTYAERFKRQYDQFKAHAEQTKSGTPLAHVPFLTEARRAELRALNIYTLEALAAVDGQELKNLGQGGRELKNKAEAYIAGSINAAHDLSLAAENEAMKARLQALEDDNAALKAKRADEDAMFDDMTDVQLKEYIKTNTGAAPIGNPGRKTLIRSAMDARPSKAA